MLIFYFIILVCRFIFIKIIVRELHDKYGQVSLLDLLQIARVALHESMPLLLLLFDINCSCASQR